MSYTYSGDAKFGASLSVNVPKPLDSRLVVNTTADLYNIPVDQAYRGMTVSNLEDGNLYVLIDKNNITGAEGWKSSKASIQIVSCSKEEYELLEANTNADYQPINPDQGSLIENVYYYIYEEEGQQSYLSSDWGQNIEDQLSQKASTASVEALLTQVNADISNLQDNYTTTEDINTLLDSTYVTNETLSNELTTQSNTINTTLTENYYTKQNVDDKFVTKEALGGDISDLDGEKFVFVTSAQYAVDQEALQAELDQTIKTNSDGSLGTVTVGQIKSPVVEGETSATIDVTSSGLSINGDPLATKSQIDGVQSQIPIIETISQEDYNLLVDGDMVDGDKFYYVFNTDDTLSYVVNKDLTTSYHTINQYQQWVGSNTYTKNQIDETISSLNSLIEQLRVQISDLEARITTLEGTPSEE